jgi:enterochelin esterase-like enzyme
MISRRGLLLSASFAALRVNAGCSRRETKSFDGPPRSVEPLPAMPAQGAMLPRGRVGTQTWSFDGDGRAVVVVPSWVAQGERLPVLVALHGRGEAVKGPDQGVMGWPRDYALLRAIERLCAPPLRADDYEGFVESRQLSQTNADLERAPFRGLVVVCPYVPDLDLRKPAPIDDYGRYLVETVLPRVRAELPVSASPAACGIDGVSLGGAVALRVGLSRALAFGALGTLQAAIGEDQVQELTALAKAARTTNPKLRLRLLTSHDDYFRAAIKRTSSAWSNSGIEHDFADIPGPHDYPFNRGPGALEMLLWHDRNLTRA